MEGVTRFAAGVALIMLVVACSSGGSARHAPTAPTSSPTTSAMPVVLAEVPPVGAVRMAGNCGTTAIFKGGSLPDWATVNAPKIPYVVATPGSALGYLFNYPLKAGPPGSNKILWYVGIPRDGDPLMAVGHPLGAAIPVASFSSEANSSPGEIFPSGPTAPSPGCWQFTLTWLNGEHHVAVDLLFT